MIKGSVTDKIYHGCTTGQANSEKKLIDFKKGESCLLPTKDPFWAEPRNLKMQTRNSEKKQMVVPLNTYNYGKIIKRKITFKYNQTIITCI